MVVVGGGRRMAPHFFVSEMTSLYFLFEYNCYTSSFFLFTLFIGLLLEGQYKMVYL